MHRIGIQNDANIKKYTNIIVQLTSNNLQKCITCPHYHLKAFLKFHSVSVNLNANNMKDMYSTPMNIYKLNN